MIFSIVVLALLIGLLALQIRARRRAASLPVAAPSPQEQLSRAVASGILRAVAILAAVAFIVGVVLSLARQ